MNISYNKWRKGREALIRYEAALQQIAQPDHPRGYQSNEIAREALGDRFITPYPPLTPEELWEKFRSDTRYTFKEINREALRPYYEGLETLMRAFGWKMWYEGLTVQEMYAHRLKKQATQEIGILSLFKK